MDEERKTGLNRREFLGTTALGAAAAAALAAGMAVPGVAEAAIGPTHERKVKSWAIKTAIRPATQNRHPVSPDYHRMDQKNTISSRTTWDDSAKDIPKRVADTLKALQDAGAPGYGPYDQALTAGSAVGASQLGTQALVPNGGLTSWKPLSPTFKAPPKFEIKDLAEHTARMKHIAITYGASDVGVTKLDMNWVYSNHFIGGKSVPMNLPDGITNAIVLVVEADHDAVATSPTEINLAETGIGLSKMALIVASLSEAIRSMGYTAIPSLNDTALNVPLAIDAGLGEQGRLGLLIHPKWGARCRLGKVLTDMPLQSDHRIEFGAHAFCRVCKKCAEKCPAKAISMDDEMSAKNPSLSENPGVLKWQVNHEKCRGDGWATSGTNCSICVAVCPYNKGDGWMHDATKLVLAKTPLVGSAVARADNLMEYGKQLDPNEWWKKE